MTKKCSFEYKGDSAKLIDAFHKWRRRLEQNKIKITNWKLQ